MNTQYEITTDLIESAPATIQQVRAFGLEYPGWNIEIEAAGEELRMYATRDGSDDSTPSRYSDWEMVTPDYGYLVIGHELHLTDAQQVEAWMQQEAPAASELTEEDLTCAIMAHDVLRGYQMTRNTYGGFNFEQWIFGAPTREAHLENMRMIERGFAVLSGYVLWKTDRCPMWTDPTPAPESAVISAVHRSGYLAMQPMHRRWYLVPASKITISEAAQIIFGDASQSAIVRIASMIADGDLDLFISKTERNPQRQRRVSREQALEMRDYLLEHKD